MANQNLEELQLFTKAEFPNQDVLFIGDGWSSFAFQAGKKIIRFPKVSLDAYRKEQRVLNFVRPYLSVNIPNLTIIEGKHPYVMHDIIGGQNWSAQTFEELTLSEKDNFCLDIACFLHEMHAIPLSSAQETLPASDLLKQLPPPQSALAAALGNMYSASRLDKVYRLLELREKTCKDKVLLYNDFYAGNSVVDNKHRLCGVFDFVDVSVADRHYDFRRIYACYPGEIFSRIINHYQQISHREINLTKVKLLRMTECISCIVYFHRNPHLKLRLEHEWLKQLENLQKLIDMPESEFNLS